MEDNRIISFEIYQSEERIRHNSDSYYWIIPGTEYVSSHYYKTAKECAIDFLTRCLQSVKDNTIKLQ
ncbi:MAG: hypothetical protein M0Q12_09030 [Synergistaceae bacterium]|jgi:hypothetical protein|nr:hypothetical protein [Synergistaceae bacterium]